MPSLLDVDFIQIRRMVQEFTQALDLSGEPEVECVYTSDDFPQDRQVFEVRVGERRFALKVDHQSPETGRLADEFAIHKRLHTHFAQFEKVSVPEPYYLSPGGAFFVSEFLDRHTASKAIRFNEDARAVGQVYRRAGGWLHALHGLTPHAPVKVWPKWMIEAVEEAVSGEPVQAEDFGPMVDALKQQAQALEGREGLAGFCHGDFHSSNLILGKGVTYGFDFTESGEKMMSYDIVDFLKVDAFVPCDPSEVDGAGIRRAAREMFFRLYRHPVDTEVLDMCLRGRLLIDWLGITQERFARSKFQRKKFAALGERLAVAFGR